MRASTKRMVLLALAGAGLLFGGCAAMDKEDEGFYTQGWLHPTDLDDPSWKQDASRGPASVGSEPIW